MLFKYFFIIEDANNLDVDFKGTYNFSNNEIKIVLGKLSIIIGGQG